MSISAAVPGRSGWIADNCSGDMEDSEPPKYATGESPDVSVLKLMLKSASFGTPSAVSRTLAGLMSRCSTPWLSA